MNTCKLDQNKNSYCCISLCAGCSMKEKIDSFFRRVPCRKAMKTVEALFSTLVKYRRSEKYYMHRFSVSKSKIKSRGMFYLLRQRIFTMQVYVQGAL